MPIDTSLRHADDAAWVLSLRQASVPMAMLERVLVRRRSEPG
jgi:hypothetical protein